MHADTAPRSTDPRVGSAIVYLIVGLPGAGKTTHAKELEISAPALRLTPDEWQIALFGDQNPPDKRDLVEGKLVQLGMRAAEAGHQCRLRLRVLGQGRTISAPLDRWHRRCAEPSRLPADRPRGATPACDQSLCSNARSNVPHERR